MILSQALDAIFMPCSMGIVAARQSFRKMANASEKRSISDCRSRAKRGA
jgi:hypothetical protein